MELKTFNAPVLLSVPEKTGQFNNTIFDRVSLSDEDVASSCEAEKIYYNFLIESGAETEEDLKKNPMNYQPAFITDEDGNESDCWASREFGKYWNGGISLRFY